MLKNSDIIFVRGKNNMEILLIRHGESEADILNVHEGSADFSLTENGINQARKMANRVKQEFPPDFIWSSTMTRAKQTAEILANVISCPIEFTTELREHDNGNMAGKPLDEVAFPSWLLPHEKWGEYGESKIEFRARGEHILSHILKNSNQYKRIAIVTHGGMISRVIESFLQLPVNHNIFFKTEDTGIHLLEYGDQYKFIKFTNSATHLNQF